MAKTFSVRSKFKPAGDQPTATVGLVDGIDSGFRTQVLLGDRPGTFTERMLLKNCSVRILA